MAGFPLSFLTNQIQNIDNRIDVLASAKDANDLALLELLDGLSNGETILGKIVSSDDKTYSFKTGDNVLVSAKAENGVMLEVGKTVLFEVAKTSDSHVSLRPLNVNTNSSQTAEMAIKQAGLQVNSETLELTVRNMEYGNPIDKKSLLSSFKDVYNNPGVPIKYIVDLQKMGIERTPENLKQYENYLNTKQSVTNSFSEISSTMSLEFSKEISEHIVSNFEKGNVTDLKELETLINKAVSEVEAESSEESVGSFIPKLTQKIKDSSDNVMPLVTENEEESAGKIQKPVSFDKKEVLEKLDTILKPILKNTIDKAIQKNWILNKETISEKESVTDLYKKLFEDTKSLQRELAQIFPKESPVLTQLNTLSNNLDFIESLNHFIPYVQIPFKGENGNKAGELYVFSNKRGLSSPDSSVSAFIHLDTNNLGPADIYVKLSGSNITTNFILSNEESLDFIEKNISFLDKRLSDKGYNLSFSSQISKDCNAPIETMLSMTNSKVMLAHTSFDARV
ncbi:MAG: flagellar hook-length control protein FliK [Lachnospiraceae bacterium]|nr:flagellar hook-length control protein FliK [Lachnospiraceae bacterium]